MPIQSPDSDSRRYQELFDEALSRIPAHSPQWTNSNQSDAGVALVQLFAWVANTLRYPFDKIPKSHRAILRKFVARLRPCTHVLIIGRRKKSRSMLVQFIASKLGLRLYCVDLAAVGSKYLDEREKYLRQLFDAENDKTAILFFDEVDVVFGKRSRVKDSHDRYTNIELDYLLERLEEFKCIAIFASSRCEDFDAAFLRQFKWIIFLGKKTSN